MCYMCSDRVSKNQYAERKAPLFPAQSVCPQPAAQQREFISDDSVLDRNGDLLMFPPSESNLMNFHCECSFKIQILRLFKQSSRALRIVCHRLSRLRCRLPVEREKCWLALFRFAASPPPRQLFCGTATSFKHD